MNRFVRLLAAALLGAAVLGACDRRLEPYVPGEEPATPDLSRIFEPEVETADAPPPAGGAAPAAPDTAPVTGSVRLADGLAGRVPPGATLFLIARRGAGGPPLAVKALPVPDFPYAFEIGPDDRMIRELPFAGPLTLSARVDADGNATTRAPGDLAGAAAAPVDPGATGVVVVIDEVVEDAAG